LDGNTTHRLKQTLADTLAVLVSLACAYTLAARDAQITALNQRLDAIENLLQANAAK
jgi:hypothetical protein